MDSGKCLLAGVRSDPRFIHPQEYLGAFFEV